MRNQIVEHERNIVVVVSDIGLRTRQRGCFEIAPDTVSGKFGDPPSLATFDAGFGASSFVASAANAEAARKLNARTPYKEGAGAACSLTRRTGSGLWMPSCGNFWKLLVVTVTLTGVGQHV